MALSFAHGAVQWTTSDTVGTVFTISGLSFQPKALRFYWTGIQSSTDAVSTTVSERRGVGFAVSTSSRRASGSLDVDNAGSMTTAVIASDVAVAAVLTDAGATDGLLDLNSITSDGFTLIVDDQLAAQSITVYWEAWGGSDITVAVVGQLTEPAGTGNQDYTVTGFVASATDQVVMFAGGSSGAPASSTSTTVGDSSLCVGFATSGNSANNVVVLGSNDEGSASADTDGYCKTGECLAVITVAGGNPAARAQLTQFGTNNFRLNWIARAVTGRCTIFMALKGGAWQAGAVAIAGNAANALASVGPLTYAPVGVSLMGRMTAESTAGTATAEDRIGLGTGTSTSSRRSMGVLSVNGAGNADIQQTIQYDQVLSYSSSGVLGPAYDLDALPDFIEQNNVAATSAGALRGNGGTTEAVGQSFTTAADYSVTAIRVRFDTNTGTPGDQVTLSLYSDSAFTALLGASSAITVVDGGVYNTFTFAAAIALSSGVKYYFAIERTGARDDVNFYQVNISTTSAYAGGGFFGRDSGVWSGEHATADVTFKVVGTNGFSLITDLTGGVASEWIGYLTFGTAPSTILDPYVPSLMRSRMRTW